jgi:PadR family transcriptional regulator, regulatory protein PadR
MVERASAVSQLRRGVLEYCVLAALRERERYGYELVSALDGVLRSEGTVYPLLARLRKEGWVASRWGESASGPPRRYYRLTADGHDALTAFTGEWESFREAVDGLLGRGERECLTQSQQTSLSVGI